MKFKKYMHVERFGTVEVEGIEAGNCYIFPKIDGTNASVWLDDDGFLCAGSRRRQLSLDQDNAGFLAAMLKNDRIIAYLEEHPEHRLFGEWLVPHSIKTYLDNKWNEFYIFDVMIGEEEYIPYNIYQPLLEEFGLEYIPPQKIIKNPTLETLKRELQNNDYLMPTGQVGEGIVIKNYDFYNQFGRQVWAKMVTSDFKEKHRKEMGVPSVNNTYTIEERIVDEFLTEAMVDKVYAKIVNEKGGWRSQYIPQLLNTVYYDLVTEEIWNFVKKLKVDKLSFKRLQNLTFARVKEYRNDIFN